MKGFHFFLLTQLAKSVFSLACFITLFSYTISSNAQGLDSTQLVSNVDQILIKSEALKNENRYEEALALVISAKEICVEAQNWELLIKIGLEAADILLDLGHPQRHATELDKAIKIAKTNPGFGNNYLANALRLKGEFFIEQDQLDSAEYVLNESIEIGTQVGQWDEIAWSLIVKSVVNYYQSDLTAMEFNLDEAIRVVDNEVTDSEEYSETIAQLETILYKETGNAQKAMAASQKSLTRLRAKTNMSNIDSIGLANAYNNHGAIYNERGDYEQAIKHYKIALSLHEQIQNSPIFNQIRIGKNISLAYKKSSDWDLAEYYLLSNKSILPTRPNRENYKVWIQTHQLLAANYIDQEKYEEALKLLEIVIPQTEHYDFYQEWTYGTLGRAMKRMGKPEKAKHYLDKAIVKFKDLYGDKHEYVALLQRLKGEAYLMQDSLNLSLQEFQNALKTLIPSDDSITTINGNPDINDATGLIELLSILDYKGQVLTKLSEKNHELSSLTIDTYRNATQVIDVLRSRHESDEAKLLLSSKAKGIYEAIIDLLFKQYQSEQDQDLLLEAFQYSEKSKALLLQEHIQSFAQIRKISKHQSKDTTLFNTLINQGRSIKNELLFFETKLKKAQEARLPSDNPKIKNAERAIADLYLKTNQWESQIKTHFPTYYEIQKDTIITDFDAIRNRLINKNGGLIEYFIGVKNTYAFVISRQSSDFLKIGKSKTIFDLTQKYKTQLANQGAMSLDAKNTIITYNKIAAELYDLILKRAIALLPNNTESLVLIPDAYLTSVPFEALNKSITENPSSDFMKLSFLLYDYQIQYGYSANTLIINQNQYDKLESNTNCLAFAPIYNSDSNEINKESPKKLNGTFNEIKAISKYFSGEFVENQNATELKFKQKAGRFGLLHLASHGAADFENPEFAHLKFYNASSDTTNDNLLHHYEIVDMNLNCQLAVLSACETGLGKLEKGEGVISLARGFMLAGVPSVVMSLWQIDDKSTSELIPIYYKYLSKGYSKNRALQKAKVDFINNANLKNRHPYYWSGLVLIGEEQQLKQAFTFWNYWSYLCLFIIIILVFISFRRKLINMSK